MTEKKALVTGASGGIGLVFAKRLAKEGHRVTLVARNKEALDAAVAELGAGHRALVADLSKPEDIEKVAADLRTERYELLINNAGVGAFGSFAETPLAKQQAMMRLNIDAVVALSHAFLASAKRGDALINVASTLGLTAFPYASVYAATKAFVVSFSENLWFENKDREIYVMGLLPGVTKTNFHAASGGVDENKPPESIAQTADEVVEEALRALKARSAPTVITGIKNRMMVLSTRMMSRKGVVNMMGGFSPKPKSAPN